MRNFIKIQKKNNSIKDLLCVHRTAYRWKRKRNLDSTYVENPGYRKQIWTMYEKRYSV